jgi:3-hydroxyisobutyrate dehydrogenase-like beta-hydroxyacid dehydrogenase
MGKKTIYCGGAGNGSVAKICNNMAMAISMLGVSEAFALGQNLGIKASVLTDIFNCSSARCWSRYCVLFTCPLWFGLQLTYRLNNLKFACPFY